MGRAELIVVHGGGVTASLYQRLADALADRVTMHLYDRRGRAGAGEKPADYSTATEIADLAAVIERTGCRNVLGHSIGGYVVLRAALELPVERIALYDPAVAIDDLFPMAFVPDMQAAVDDGDLARAIAVMGRGTGAGGPASRLPLGLQTALCRAFLHTSVGRTMGELLPTTIPEIREAVEHAGPASAYAGITAPTLLATGAWSPPYYARINRALAAVMPDAHTVVIPRAGHDAPNVARGRFVDELATFFASSPVSR